MANYRSVQTRLWREDEWFDTLPLDARLFWIYLFTNPSSSPAGIYRLTLRTMSNETGISQDRVRELMGEFAKAGKAHYERGVVWVVKMRRLQYPDLDGSGAWQIAKKMRDDIDDIPESNPLKRLYLEQVGYPVEVEVKLGGKMVKRIMIRYGYPINRPSIIDTDTDTDTNNYLASQDSGAGAPANLFGDLEEPVVMEPDTEPKPKRGGRKPVTVKEPKPAKEPPPEAIVWFRSVVGRYPPKVLWDSIVAVVDARKDEAFLKECWKEWVARGYRKDNYAWLLEWYADGVVTPKDRSNGRDTAYHQKMEALIGD